MRCLFQTFLPSDETPELVVLVKDHELDNVDIDVALQGMEEWKREEITRCFPKRRTLTLSRPALTPAAIQNWSSENEDISKQFRGEAKQIWEELSQIEVKIHGESNNDSGGDKVKGKSCVEKA